MIKEFNTKTGKNITGIPGQNRLAFALSGNEDFYDLEGWSERGGYQGSVIIFYDFENGEVYVPFEKKRNVVYGRPVYHDGYCYFLRGDYDLKLVTLYRYAPEKEPETVTLLNMDELDLYNLQIIGNGINIVSMGDVFRSYYPEKFTIGLEPQDTVCLIDEGKVYIERWIEKGWDAEKDRAADDYDFHDMVIVRDKEGNVISETTGSLFQREDGTWWIG